VADQLIFCAYRAGLPVALYRPGRITGHHRTGVASVEVCLCDKLFSWLMGFFLVVVVVNLTTPHLFISFHSFIHSFYLSVFLSVFLTFFSLSSLSSHPTPF
jgi:hypothetical protein